MNLVDLEYVEIDGLLYPNLDTGMESIENELSKYGILRLRYLHEHKREMYRELLLTGKLAEHWVRRLTRLPSSSPSRYRRHG